MSCRRACVKSGGSPVLEGVGSFLRGSTPRGEGGSTSVQEGEGGSPLIEVTAWRSGDFGSPHE